MREQVIANRALRRISAHWFLLALLLTYTILHTLFGAWYVPMKVLTGQGKLIQIEEEIAPLRQFIATGTPITLENPRQYGPVFLFTLYPLVRYTTYPLFEYILYGIGLLGIAAAFWVTYRAIFPIDVRKTGLILLAALWFNTSSLYFILGTKNVEAWEVLLLALILLALVKRKSVLGGTAAALATLIKLLPIFFAFTLLIRDRKALRIMLIALVAVLGISHLAFGPMLGMGYLPGVLQHAFGPDAFSQNYFENNAIRGVIYRAVSGFTQGENPYLFTATSTQRMNAFTIAALVQLLVFGVTAWHVWRTPSPMIAFGISAVAMLLLSPSIILEYAMLLLPAFSVGLWAILAGKTTAVQKTLFGASYILLGHFVPFNLLLQSGLVQKLQLLGFSGLTVEEVYKAIGLPFVGYLCLFAFFALMQSATTARRQPSG